MSIRGEDEYRWCKKIPRISRIPLIEELNDFHLGPCYWNNIFEVDIGLF